MSRSSALTAMPRLLRIRSTPSESPGLAAVQAGLGAGYPWELVRTWRAVRRALQHPPPRLVVIDWEFCEGDPAAQIGEIISHWPDTPVLVHSALAQSLYAERALRAGAHGFLSATAPAHEAAYALEAILGGRIYLSPGFSVSLLRRLFRHPATASAPAGLSSRELAVLRLIGEGRPNRAIARALSISVKTVETHRANLKRKLGAVDTAALREAARTLHAAP